MTNLPTCPTCDGRGYTAPGAIGETCPDCGGGLPETAGPPAFKELHKLNHESGRHFWSPDTLRFFQSKDEHHPVQDVFGNTYFVTSQKTSFDDETRIWRLHRFNLDSSVDTFDERYTSREDAIMVLGAAASSRLPVETPTDAYRNAERLLEVRRGPVAQAAILHIKGTEEEARAAANTRSIPIEINAIIAPVVVARGRATAKELNAWFAWGEADFQEEYGYPAGSLLWWRWE